MMFVIYYMICPHLEDFRTPDGGGKRLNAYLMSAPSYLDDFGRWEGFSHSIPLFRDALGIFDTYQVY